MVRVMSKSLTRDRIALRSAGLKTQIVETPLARTAQDAAQAMNCKVDQIAKSIIFCGEQTGAAILFLTAGGNRVNTHTAAGLAGEPLGKADANLIRSQTGFAIGGVAPIGHLSPIRAFFDPRLIEFDLIWAAAGTPRHVFSVEPAVLQKICNAELADFTS